MSRAWADIDLGAVAANVETMAAVAAPSRLCAVVKAGGYGHGAAEVSRAALDAGASWLAVAHVGEAAELRAAGIAAPVLLLSEPRDGDDAAAAVSLDLRLTLYSQRSIERVRAAVSSAGRSRHPVHLKVDTGMRRVGAAPKDAIELAAAISDGPELTLEGVCTHCPVADEPANPFTARQLDRFDAVVRDLTAAGFSSEIRHAANSAACMTQPASRYEMVRCGIALYGVAPAPVLTSCVSLRPALRFTSEVAFVKAVTAGEGISYGLHHTFADDTCVATVPVGYADGVWRKLGLLGQDVLIRGRRRPIVGAVTMDQLMVDVGHDNVECGDEVVLLGDQGDERITPDEWAAKLDTIAYEVVCAIGPRVQRRYHRS
jgi:alanine racemase